MNFLPQKTSESGQILVVVLLVISVSLLVGVGIATRSISVVQQTTFSEEATRSLHFAEACAEEALRLIKEGTIHDGNLPYDGYCDVDGLNGCDTTPVDGQDCSFNVTELSDIFPGVVSQDEVVEVKVGSGFTCGSVDVYWCVEDEGDECSSVNPALEVIVVRESEIAKEIYRSGSSKFTAPDPGGSPPGETTVYAYKVTLAVAAGTDKAVRFIPRFGDSHIAVRPSGACSLGHQGYRVQAEGTFGRSTREVEVTRTEPAMPAIFDYSIFSGSETEPLEKR